MKFPDVVDPTSDWTDEQRARGFRFISAKVDPCNKGKLLVEVQLDQKPDTVKMGLVGVLPK